MVRKTAQLMLLVLLGALTILGQSKQSPSNGDASSVSPPPGAKPGGAPNSAVGVGVDPKSYVMGPEDVLYVRVWREPDFSLPVSVRPDGKITMPLVGDLQASGLTPLQLGKEVASGLSKYINTPDVTIIVEQVNSKKYYITGGVLKTGSFPLVVPTTVLEALSNAGGFKEFANTKKIKILRGSKRLSFNYKQVINGKHLEQNIYLENGDYIIVPE